MSKVAAIIPTRRPTILSGAVEAASGAVLGHADSACLGIARDDADGMSAIGGRVIPVAFDVAMVARSTISCISVRPKSGPGPRGSR